MKLRQESEMFMKSMDQSKIDRFKFLIKQTDIFTHFLMGSSGKACLEQTKTIKSSKHRNKKEPNIIKQIKKDDIDIEQGPEITRLYYQPSTLTGGSLKEYQLDALNWLINLYENGLNGILADEMGLGKTIETIAFLAYLKQYKKKNGYFLVVVPKSTMPNWNRELKLWLPSLNVVVLNPVKEEREEALKLINKHKFEVVITSYEGILTLIFYNIRSQYLYWCSKENQMGMHGYRRSS